MGLLVPGNDADKSSKHAARPPTIFYKANPYLASTDLRTATQLLYTLKADHAGHLFVWEYIGYLEEIVCKYTSPDQASYRQARGLLEDLETIAKAFNIPKSEYLVWELGGLAKKDKEAREEKRVREEERARKKGGGEGRGGRGKRRELAQRRGRAQRVGQGNRGRRGMREGRKKKDG
jgi:hypothetical protein